jgi:hypothetical protein
MVSEAAPARSPGSRPRLIASPRPCLVGPFALRDPATARYSRLAVDSLAAAVGRMGQEIPITTQKKRA